MGKSRRRSRESFLLQSTVRVYDVNPIGNIVSFRKACDMACDMLNDINPPSLLDKNHGYNGAEGLKFTT
jgi:hypothetical protein